MRSASAPLQSGQRAQVTLLGKKATRLEGQIVDHRGAVVTMVVPSSVPAGAAIQIDCGDTLFLGEVRFCRPDGEAFQVALDVEQAVYDTAQLARLAERILGEA